MSAESAALTPLPIDGLLLRPLRVIPTEGGPVLHMLRTDAPEFAGFGEVYFSEVEVGAVKAWKCHSRQTQHFAVPHGLLKLVFYDGRDASPTHGAVCTVTLGRPENYALLTVPTGVWYGISAVGGGPALLCNCADIPHDPAESRRLPKDDPSLPYTWA